MSYSIEDRRAKWRNFMNGDDGVNTIYLIETDEMVKNGSARPLPWPGLLNERIDWAYDDYNMQLARAEWLADDKIPVLSPYTGTEIFAEAFGCKVHYPSNNMPFALPKYVTLAEAASLKIPNVHDTPLDNLFEIARRLKQKAGNDTLMHLPDIQSPLDISALIVDKVDFYSGMSEDPQAIHELAMKTKTLLIAFLDEWFYEFGTSYVAHFPLYYMEGGVTLSEDEIGAFSSGMFVEYVLGALNELSEKYGGIGIHCCADSEHQWENLSKVKGLRILNLVQDRATLERSIKFFGNTVAHWPLTDGRPHTENEPPWFERCPDDVHVVLIYNAQTRQSAVEVAKRASDLCVKRRG